MKSTIRLTIIAAMIVVGVMMMFGDPMPESTTGEWLSSIAIGVAIVVVASWLFSSWDAKGLIAEDVDKEW